MNLLRDKITADVVRVSELEQIYFQYRFDPRFFARVVSALEVLEPKQIWRGFWLLRRLAREFSAQEMAILAGHADSAEYWTARLNLCQLLAVTGVPASVRDDLFPFLRGSFADHRQIIRAWAISALVSFREDEHFRVEIAAMLIQARRKKGKAMQARLRQLKLSSRK